LPKDGSVTAMADEPAREFVSIVIPALNEEAYIRAAISSIIPADERAFGFEVLVLDGGSADGTCAAVLDLALVNPKVRLIANERRFQSAAVNKGAAQADPRATIILRADSHAEYPAGFAERCVAALRENGADSVVVPMRTRGEACLQKAIAAAQNSVLGNGGSSHRRSGAGRSGFVEHGHHAAFDRAAFLASGGYDETFTHNEDAEFDHRFRLGGRRIWFCADNPVIYFPRKTFPALARQYFNHGRGRGRTLSKHGVRPKLRQMIPVAALAAALLAILGAAFEPLLALPLLSYLAVCLGWGLPASLRARDPCLLLLGAAAIVMHLSWATGLLLALVSPAVHKSTHN
jgi:succinoglycan biosynthesis protein ExoA